MLFEIIITIVLALLIIAGALKYYSANEKIDYEELAKRNAERFKDSSAEEPSNAPPKQAAPKQAPPTKQEEPPQAQVQSPQAEQAIKFLIKFEKPLQEENFAIFKNFRNEYPEIMTIDLSKEKDKARIVVPRSSTLTKDHIAQTFKDKNVALQIKAAQA